MKIVRLTTYQVPPRWLFLKMDTDEGVVGWGEPVLEGHTQAVEAAVRAFEPALLGQDPHRIADLWQVMYRGGFYRGGPVLMSALAGVDQALWDIKGKALGVPVYELLGGLVRDRVRMYSWVGGDRPKDLVEGIERLRGEGFSCFKFNACDALPMLGSYACLEPALERVAEVRAAFGHEVDFAVDFHGRFSLPMAKTMIKEMEPYHPLFIEEPVLPEHADGYAQLAAQTPLPLAAGERMYSRFDARSVLEGRGLSILQPDLSHAGGLTECFKIAALAETYNVALAPHCPLGPLALASCLHLDFVSWNAVLQEQSSGIHYNAGADLLDYVVNKEVFSFKDGYAYPPTQPGLGVLIDEEVVRERSRAHAWRTPLWRAHDGSVAEW